VAKHNSSPEPRISLSAPVELVDGDVQTLEPHESYEGERFDGGDLTDADLSGVALTECVLDAVTLTDAVLRGARFVDCLVNSSFATSLVAARSTWRRVRIDNARWGSAELFDSEFESVIISGGKIDFLNFRGAKLTDVLIENAQITELDVASFIGTRVAIRNCRIETLDFTRATCLDVDLRASTFTRVLGIQGMRGTILSEEQLADFAPIMAGQLGIRVE
jgi:uncharacterized protein YjbI with pentapeptide repeats